MSEPWAYPLGLAGNALALWAIAALGIAPTSGDESMLVYRGPYRFSRNPQYVGFIAALIGWALLTNAEAGQMIITEAARKAAGMEWTGLESRRLELKGRREPVEAWVLEMARK